MDDIKTGPSRTRERLAEVASTVNDRFLDGDKYAFWQASICLRKGKAECASCVASMGEFADHSSPHIRELAREVVYYLGQTAG